MHGFKIAKKSRMSIKESKNRITLCLLTWNEIEGCKSDIPHVPDIFSRIISIDNNSTDGTIEFLQSHGIEVFKQKTPSYNGAYVDAFEYAENSSIVFFHPKGSINIESLNDVVFELRNGADFVLASRIAPGAQNEEDSHFLKPRKWFVICIAIFCKIRWGMNKTFYLDDPLHGFRGLSHNFYARLGLILPNLTADVEMVRHAYKNEFNISIIPVLERERLGGVTHFPAWSTGLKIMRFVFSR